MKRSKRFRGIHSVGPDDKLEETLTKKLVRDKNYPQVHYVRKHLSLSFLVTAWSPNFCRQACTRLFELTLEKLKLPSRASAVHLAVTNELVRNSPRLKRISRKLYINRCRAMLTIHRKLRSPWGNLARSRLSVEKNKEQNQKAPRQLHRAIYPRHGAVTRFPIFPTKKKGKRKYENKPGRRRVTFVRLSRIPDRLSQERNSQPVAIYNGR